MENYGIDFDGTIADTNRMKSVWIKQNLGKIVAPYEADRTNCVPLIGLDNYERMSEIIFDREATLKTPEIPGALKGLEELSKKGRLYIVTMRGTKKMSYAQEWLKQHDAMQYISGLGMIENSDRTKKTKEELCGELSLNVLIDDDARHLRKINLPDFTRIWFRNGAGETLEKINGIYIAKNWEEIIKLF